MSLIETLLVNVIANTSSAEQSLKSTSQRTDELVDSLNRSEDAIGRNSNELGKQTKATEKNRDETKEHTKEKDRATSSERENKESVVDTTQEIERQTKALDKGGFSLTNFAAKAVGALAGVVAIGQTVTGVADRARDVVALSQTADALGVAVEDLDAFGKAAQQAGGDAEGARDTLTDVAEKIGEAFSDAESGAAKAFKALNVSVKDSSGKARDAISGFLDLAGAVEGLDRSAAVFKIKELGITDNRSVELILKGRKELERMVTVQKEQGVVTKETVERARQFNDGLNALKGSISNAGASFFDMLIPALTKAIDWLRTITDWAAKHKDFVVGFFAAVALIVTAAYLPAMLSAAAATIAATWPIIAIGAAIAAAAAAFALIYDDIMNFIDGNDSLTGQIFEKYPMVKDAVFAVIDAFKAMFDILSTGAAQIANFVTLAFQQIVAGIKFAIDYLTEAYGSVRAFVDSALTAFQGLGEGVAAIFRMIVDTVKGSLAFVTGSIDKIKGAAGKVTGFFGFGGDDAAASSGTTPGGDIDNAGVSQSLLSANQAIQSASLTPMNAITSSAISNSANRSSETNVQTGDIIVQTQATDAQGISQDVGSELQSQLKNLSQETSTGVAR